MSSRKTVLLTMCEKSMQADVKISLRFFINLAVSPVVLLVIIWQAEGPVAICPEINSLLPA